jgi:hypothetical protein
MSNINRNFDLKQKKCLHPVENTAKYKVHNYESFITTFVIKHSEEVLIYKANPTNIDFLKSTCPASILGAVHYQFRKYEDEKLASQ